MAIRHFCDLCDTMLDSVSPKVIKAIAILDKPGHRLQLPGEASKVKLPATVTVDGEFCKDCKDKILENIMDASKAHGTTNKRLGS